MTDRMESGTPGDNSADPTKGPKTADGSQDCSCAEARAHLEAFLDRECLSALRATAVSVTTTSTTTRTQASASGRVVRVVESRVESSRTVRFEHD